MLRASKLTLVVVVGTLALWPARPAHAQPPSHQLSGHQPAGHGQTAHGLALPLHAGGQVTHIQTHTRAPLKSRQRLARQRLRRPLRRHLAQTVMGATKPTAGLLSSLGELVGVPATRRKPARRVRLRGLSVRNKVVAEVPGLLPGSTRRLARLTADTMVGVMPGSFSRLERAIEMMHASGVAHGAITVANLRVDPFGQLYLVGGWHNARSAASKTELLADKAGLDAVRAAFSGAAR